MDNAEKYNIEKCWTNRSRVGIQHELYDTWKWYSHSHLSTRPFNRLRTLVHALARLINQANNLFVMKIVFTIIMKFEWLCVWIASALVASNSKTTGIRIKQRMFFSSIQNQLHYSVGAILIGYIWKYKHVFLSLFFRLESFTTNYFTTKISHFYATDRMLIQKKIGNEEMMKMRSCNNNYRYGLIDMAINHCGSIAM